MTKRKATKNKGVLPESTQPVAEIKNDDLDFHSLLKKTQQARRIVRMNTLIQMMISL